MELDARDYRLLYELDLDARQPVSRLAAKLGMSKQRVSYRIARLEEKQIILGYSTLIDAARLGYTQLRTYVKLRRAGEAKTREIIDFLKARKIVWAIVRMTGPADIALGIGIRQHSEYHEFWSALEDKFKPWISGSRVSIYSPVYHFSKAYLTGARDETQPRVIGGEKVDVNELDLKILQVLARNARAEAVKIGKEAGADAETVAYRVKQLREKGVIQGYRALIDVEKLGYEFYKVDFALASAVDREKMREYCRQEPNIYQLNDTIGGADLEVEFHVKNLRELLMKIEDVKKAFPGAIESFEQYRLSAEEKMTFMPE